MRLRNLKLLSKGSRLNQSDVARAAGVSRQAVSLWFRKLDSADKEPQAAIRSTNLSRLAATVGESAAYFLDPLPGYSPSDEKAFRTEMLWDRLYPSVGDFLIAIADQHPRALARLVARRGMYGAAAIAGDVIWTDFDEYKNRLRPKQREDFSALVSWRKQYLEKKSCRE